MPSKGTNNRYKASLDTEVADKIIAFERNLYQYVDAVMPKKRKYTLVTACEERVMMARELIVEGMDYDIRFYAVTRIIYQSMPQLHCIVNSPEEMFKALPEHKKMRGKVTSVGVAIGNVTSQMVAMFLINFYLLLLQALGYKFVHYTDDTCVLVKDKQKWSRDIRLIEPYLRDELHLELHKGKRYLQHYSKGVLFLGYKLRYNRTLPSDRIAHNIDWKVTCAIRKAEADKSFMLNESEHFMQVLNSYNGLLMWCNAYRMRSCVMERVRQSCWSKVFDFYDDLHVTLKPSHTSLAYYKRLNKERKRKQESWLI